MGEELQNLEPVRTSQTPTSPAFLYYPIISFKTTQEHTYIEEESVYNNCTYLQSHSAQFLHVPLLNPNSYACFHPCITEGKLSFTPVVVLFPGTPLSRLVRLKFAKSYRKGDQISQKNRNKSNLDITALHFLHCHFFLFAMQEDVAVFPSFR